MRIELPKAGQVLCVDYDFGSGTNVYAGACNSQSNQKWTYNTSTKQLISNYDGKCMDIDLGTSKNLYMNTCDVGNVNQRFYPLSGGGLWDPSSSGWSLAPSKSSEPSLTPSVSN